VVREIDGGHQAHARSVAPATTGVKWRSDGDGRTGRAPCARPQQGDRGGHVARPRLQYLSEVEKQFVHEQTLRVLSEVGVATTRRPSLRS